ncbi:MAG: 16S rRNA (adenine(1518)-N(6)/adenine(1519)-N(6))-dimethyltransferase RsmA [Tepidisphaeraceae bacterium]
MAQTKHQIQAILAQADIHPRHRFGQNFMIDGNLVRLVAESAGIVRGDLVIEVGPGTGTLTEALLARGAHVLAVEIDRDLANHLRNKFSETPEFQLIEGDALDGKHAINAELAEVIRTKQNGTIRLVANLPFNIASPLTIELLIAGVQSLTFTVQKEVAERIVAAPGSKDYGPLSIMAQMLSKPRILRTIPPQAFWPMPKIESALLHLVREDRLNGRAREFGIFVQKIFSSRRKTLRNSLLHAGIDADRILSATGLAPTCRAEEVSPDQIWGLFLGI